MVAHLKRTFLKLIYIGIAALVRFTLFHRGLLKRLLLFIFYMMYIRRNIFHSVRGNANLIKALALAIYIKKHIVSSTITNYSLNKVRNKTGLAYSSIRKRIETLKQLGFIRFGGKNNEHLTIVCLSSKCNRRNIDLSKCVFDSVKDIEKSLTALFIVEIQKHKDFAKHTIQLAHNPKLSEHKAMKRAKKICNRYGWGKEFNEYGISYKTIAKKLGVCLQKAFEIVKFAIANNMIVKQRNQDYTFVTKNNAYKVYANSYSVVA